MYSIFESERLGLQTIWVSAFLRQQPRQTQLRAFPINRPAASNGVASIDNTVV